MTKDKPKILLVNPPIYDFTAADFWLRPFGMLTAAGKIANKVELKLFDFLNCNHPSIPDKYKYKSGPDGRSKFYCSKIPTPDALKMIPRYYRRFGLSADIFIDFLKSNRPCDFVFVQTVMTYWYLGYKEVIGLVKKYWPKTKIVLGGPYCVICPQHAKGLGADFVLTENKLPKLWNYLNIQPDKTGFAAWGLYEKNETAIIKITNGCPFKCTYCSVPLFYDGFEATDTEQAIEELKYIVSLGIKNVAFYDDSLLYKKDEALKPFLQAVIKNNIKVNFHTPNALNARFIDEQIAELMIAAGFKSIYLGFESRTKKFQSQTGSKVFDNELARAVNYLTKAGAVQNNIAAYLILGHPLFDVQDVENSMAFVNDCGIRIMLSDFSPIPQTKDCQLCEKYVDISEPLMHNKTAFPIILLGNEKVSRIKDICRKLNGAIKA